jgi:hypothetical protein
MQRVMPRVMRLLRVMPRGLRGLRGIPRGLMLLAKKQKETRLLGYGKILILIFLKMTTPHSKQKHLLK